MIWNMFFRQIKAKWFNTITVLLISSPSISAVLSWHFVQSHKKTYLGHETNQKHWAYGCNLYRSYCEFRRHLKIHKPAFYTGVQVVVSNQRKTISWQNHQTRYWDTWVLMPSGKLQPNFQVWCISLTPIYFSWSYKSSAPLKLVFKPFWEYLPYRYIGKLF